MAGARWQRRLEAAWWRADGPAPPWPLRWLAALFGRLVERRREGHRCGRRPVEHLDVPVIVVGNRIVGGAGKTPTTLALIEALRAAGWRPGVISRGHGRKGSAPQAVRQDATPRDVGDEPLLIARRSQVPVWVGRDRVAAGRALRAAHPEVDVIVCDDGLQHLRLARDLEIVVFDRRGVGNGRLLPAGPLREPIDAATSARQQWVLYNAPAPSTRLPGHLAGHGLAAPVPLADWHAGAAPQDDWLRWAGRPAWALAGIGAPQRFFDDLRGVGLVLAPQHTLAQPDHATYDTLPWPASATDLFVTEKDAVKLAPARVAAERPTTRVWVVPLRYTLPAALVDALLQALAESRRPAR